ncbi:MAG: 30S ribosomal protein S3 [Planctomycetes bacterium]|jgi:small subunit ribosomal protein S3|nr:30S ribosomal protein S3 [Planctomycetota bacterium]HNZ66004.1 30S ribosomal protein S3 [Planctomycetota bacterium]HPY75110.1 30S ribosomal protein S3 [Planctomycetota bacterium]HQB00678.1 30S ribosomal protein S3 [Planctomycetota bacterium]
MGQKVSPIGFRIGIRENWRSRWYANKKNDFSKYLHEDQKIRKFISKEYTNIPMVEIERTRERINIIIHTSKPGALIGRRGANVDKVRASLAPFVEDREVGLEVKEVNTPNTNAQLVGESIAEQLVKRANYRRAMKKAMEVAMDAGVLGIKIQISGRLSGAEMARTEVAVLGKVPLQTLDARVEYGFQEAFTTYGTIGIKVWIYHGKYGEEVAYNGFNAQKGKVSKKSAR